MKIRTGFVSNSSSSSFVLYYFALNNAQKTAWSELLSLRDEWEDAGGPMDSKDDERLNYDNPNLLTGEDTWMNTSTDNVILSTIEDTDTEKLDQWLHKNKISTALYFFGDEGNPQVELGNDFCWLLQHSPLKSLAKMLLHGDMPELLRIVIERELKERYSKEKPNEDS